METLDDARHIEGREARWGEWMGILLGELRDDSDNKFGRHEKKQMNKLIHWATVKQVRNVARGKFELIEYQPLSIGPQKKNPM